MGLERPRLTSTIEGGYLKAGEDVYMPYKNMTEHMYYCRRTSVNPGQQSLVCHSPKPLLN